MAQLSGLLGRAVSAGLCVAAAAAIVALVSGEFDDTHWRVVGTSLGFSVFSALAATGDGLRRHARDRRAAVGAATSAAAAGAYVLLVGAIWAGDDVEWLWRGFGIFGLGALCGSHASLVLRARRRQDSPLLSLLVWVSIVTATLETLVGIVGLLGVFHDVGDGFARLLAAMLVVTVLSTLLPPVQRRLRARRVPPTLGELADEIAAVARRLDHVGMPLEVRREAAALRDLADRARPS